MVWNVINANLSYLKTLILKTEAGRRNHGRQLLADSASTGVEICLANLAKGQNFL